jgi:putative membrane protein
MSDKRTSGPPENSKLETELLANERTFLAWVRTSIAVMSLGFVIARFGIWLRELAEKINPQMQRGSTGVSLPLGASMIAFGGLLTLLAGWRYHVVNRVIKSGKIEADPRMVTLITIAVVLLSCTIIIYMLVTAATAHT